MTGVHWRVRTALVAIGLGGGTMAAQAPAIPLIRELTVGQVDGPPEYALGRFELLAPARDGGFYIYDFSDTEIRRYDGTGKFRGRIGRKGSGPGEYRAVEGLQLHGDSLLLAYDPANGRISIFDTAGAYRRQITLARPGYFTSNAFHVGPNGHLYLRVGAAHGPPEGAGSGAQYLVMRLDGTAVDSIVLPIEDTSRPGEALPYVLMTADGPRYSFPTMTLTTLLPDGGLATGRNDSYRIAVQPKGRTATTLTKPGQPQKLAGAERDEWEAWSRFFAGRPNGGAPRALPAVKPYFRGLLADDAGRLWVQLYTTATRQAIPPRPAGDPRPLLTIREPNVYDVWGRDGRLIGTVSLAPFSMLLAIRGNRIWVRKEGAEGEYLVERYALGTPEARRDQ